MTKKEKKVTKKEEPRITPDPIKEEETGTKEAVTGVPKKTEEPRIAPETPADVIASRETEDYLRQYQYRKQTAFGSIASDPQPGSKAEIMKKRLLAQPKVRTFIPRKSGEDKTIKQSVTLNGYRLDFPKQTYIEVPKQISEVLMDSLEQTEKALMKNLIDGDKDKETKLG